MSVAKTTTTCPYCKESIAEGASICKHCHSDLAALKKKKPSIFARYNTFKYGFFTGAITLIVLFLLVYFKFFYH
jgi:predicted amidophosphoribosyltransferase